MLAAKRITLIRGFPGERHLMFLLVLVPSRRFEGHDGTGAVLELGSDCSDNQIELIWFERLAGSSGIHGTPFIVKRQQTALPPG